jgi:hypothetical protein
MTASRYGLDEVVIGAELVAQSLDHQVETLLVTLSASTEELHARDASRYCPAAAPSQEVHERHFVGRELHEAVADPQLSTRRLQRESRRFGAHVSLRAFLAAERVPPIASRPALEHRRVGGRVGANFLKVRVANEST